MSVNTGKPGDPEILALKGALTIERVSDLKNMLIEAFSRKDHVVLDLKGVTEVDLACLQLFCSAHRTSLEMHKQMTLESGQSEAFQQAVRDGGFTPSACSHKDPHQSCLWIGGLE